MGYNVTDKEFSKPFPIKKGSFDAIYLRDGSLIYELPVNETAKSKETKCIKKMGMRGEFTDTQNFEFPVMAVSFLCSFHSV